MSQVKKKHFFDAVPEKVAAVELAKVAPNKKNSSASLEKSRTSRDLEKVFAESRKT